MKSLLPFLLLQPTLGFSTREMLMAALVFGIIDWLYSWRRDKGDVA